MRYNYEPEEPDPYPEAVGIKNLADDVAWHVLGWQTEPDEDTEWTGVEQRTGLLVAVMVGDDVHWLVDPDDIEPLAREDYCGQCGQIGCTHDGLERDDV